MLLSGSSVSVAQPTSVNNLMYLLYRFPWLRNTSFLVAANVNNEWNFRENVSVLAKNTWSKSNFDSWWSSWQKCSAHMMCTLCKTKRMAALLSQLQQTMEKYAIGIHCCRCLFTKIQYTKIQYTKMQFKNSCKSKKHPLQKNELLVSWNELLFNIEND